MSKKLKENTLAGFRPDPRPGRFGSVDTGKVPRGKSRGDYSGGAGKMQTAAGSWPYIELEIDDEEDDLDPISADLIDKLQSKIGAMRFKNDPGAKSRDVGYGSGNNRTFQGGIAESIPHAHGKIPSTVLYPKKNRGPALGGTSHSPAAYKTGPGKARLRDPGTLQGTSKPPKDNFDDGERVFNLKDIIEPENRVVIRIRKMVRDILSDDS